MTRQKQITPERKTMYYVGMGMSVLGTLMFLSIFVVIPLNFGNFNFHPENHFLIAFAGMLIAVVGKGTMRIACMGWSGSGIVLDPEQAQRDVEPWSRMGGGILNDALSEVDAFRDPKAATPPPTTVVKIRCRHCQALNDEQARFCDQCGTPV